MVLSEYATQKGATVPPALILSVKGIKDENLIVLVVYK